VHMNVVGIKPDIEESITIIRKLAESERISNREKLALVMILQFTVDLSTALKQFNDWLQENRKVLNRHGAKISYRSGL